MQEDNNKGLIPFYSEKRWMNWKPVAREGKVTKVPIGSSTDPSTWKTFDALDQALGKGIVFMPDRLLLGVDIDNCLDENQNINHERKTQIEQFIKESDTYSEISPSGRGLHIFLSATAPVSLSANRHAPYEVYATGRYFTYTGRSFGPAVPVRTVSVEDIFKLLSIIGYPWKQNEPVQSWDSPSNEAHEKTDGPVREDNAVLDLAFSSKNGVSIRALYEGDISKYGKDDSAADLALADHFAFWTAGNAEQIERLWLASPLGKRSKTATRKDYRMRTIQKAIANCKEFYKGHSKTSKSSLPHDAKTAVPANNDNISFLTSSNVVSKPISWLWKDKIAKGKVTLIAGDPGLGKSQVTLFLAATVSKGGEFPGASPCEQGDVILFSAEDDAEDTINPRLVACGADQERIHIFHTVTRKGKESFFDLSADIDLLEKALKSMPKVSLIVVDPITAFLGATDSHVNAEVRALLSRLSKIASMHAIAIVVVTHLNKSSGGNAMNKITGSLAFVAAARAAYMVVKDENDESRRLFLPVKNNLAEDRNGFAFSVESVEINNGSIRTSRVKWEPNPVQTNVSEALRNNESDRGGVSKATVDWLESYLRERPDGTPFNEVVREAARQGISRATLYRAEKHCFIEHVFDGHKRPKKWRLEWEDKVEINADDIPL